MEKFIGNVSVDSGQILIVDPCYLGEYDANEMTDLTGIRHKETGRKYFCGDARMGIIPRKPGQRQVQLCRHLWCNIG